MLRNQGFKCAIGGGGLSPKAILEKRSEASYDRRIELAAGYKDAILKELRGVGDYVSELDEISGMFLPVILHMLSDNRARKVHLDVLFKELRYILEACLDSRVYEEGGAST